MGSTLISHCQLKPQNLCDYRFIFSAESFLCDSTRGRCWHNWVMKVQHLIFLSAIVIVVLMVWKQTVASSMCSVRICMHKVPRMNRVGWYWKRANKNKIHKFVGWMCLKSSIYNPATECRCDRQHEMDVAGRSDIWFTLLATVALWLLGQLLRMLLGHKIHWTL